MEKNWLVMPKLLTFIVFITDEIFF